MTLFIGILIFLVAYLVIGGVILGYQRVKKRASLDDAEFLLYLVGWPLLILWLVIAGIIYFPVKFGEWLYTKVKENKP